MRRIARTNSDAVDARGDEFLEVVGCQNARRDGSRTIDSARLRIIDSRDATIAHALKVTELRDTGTAKPDYPYIQIYGHPGFTREDKRARPAPYPRSRSESTGPKVTVNSRLYPQG